VNARQGGRSGEGLAPSPVMLVWGCHPGKFLKILVKICAIDALLATSATENVQLSV